MKLTSLLSALVLSISLTSSAAFAEEAKKEEAPLIFQAPGYNMVGGSLGIAKPVGSNFSTPLRFNFGAEFSHAILTELSLGAFASRNNGVVTHSSVVDFGITRVGLQAVYSPISDALFYVRAGVSFLDVSATVAGVSIKADVESKPLFAGPGFGWVFPVTNKIQVIPNLQYTRFFKTDDTATFNVFDAMFTLRYTL